MAAQYKGAMANPVKDADQPNVRQQIALHANKLEERTHRANDDECLERILLLVLRQVMITELRRFDRDCKFRPHTDFMMIEAHNELHSSD